MKINGIEAPDSLLDDVITFNEDGNQIIEQWKDIRYNKDSNPEGFRKKYQYFVHRFFLENNTNNWCNFIFLQCNESFYEYNNGIWIKLKSEKIQNKNKNTSILSIISLKCIEYFGETFPNLVNQCLNALKSFFPKFKFKQNENIIPFRDCGLNRNALMEKRIEIVDPKPSDQIVDFIDKNVKNEFRMMDSTFDLNLAINLIKNHPISTLFNRMLPVFMQNMVFTFISDIIDFAKPLQWLFLFQSKEGGVGKGTIALIIKKIVGKDSYLNINERSMKSRFFESTLLNKRVFFMPETSKNAFSEDILPIWKSISGGDGLTVEFKGINGVLNEKTRGVFFISTNDIPSLPPSERAIFRRMVLVKMPNTPPFSKDEYENLIQNINENIESLIAKLCLFIPFKNTLHNKYKKEHNISNEYEEETIDYEYIFFERSLSTKYSNDFMISISHFYEFFLMDCEINGKRPSCQNERGFAKMFNRFLKNEKIYFRSTQKMINGIRRRIYIGIKENQEYFEEIFKRYENFLSMKEETILL